MPKTARQRRALPFLYCMIAAWRLANSGLEPGKPAGPIWPRQMDEGFRRFDAGFPAAEFGDGLVMLPPNLPAILTGVREERGLLGFQHRRNVHVRVRRKALGL